MDLLTLARGSARRWIEPGETLLADGQPAHELYVLLQGSVRIEKAGELVAVVSEPGACVGEMSLLLGVPATADARANERCEVAVVEHAGDLLERDAELALALARVLAARLQVMTTYLADLKQQYGDHEGGLGMVDAVLGSLLRSAGTRSELGSDRDPDPEY